MWTTTPSDRPVWTVGRHFVDAIGARDQWLIDYVLDDTDKLIAVCRSRPSRGFVAPLSRVIGEAFAGPRGGARLRVPARLEFLDLTVHNELLALKLPVELSFSRRRRKPLEHLVNRLIDGYVQPDGHWHWLQRGVSVASIDHLFDLCWNLSASYAWYFLSGREVITVHFTQRKQTRWMRLVAQRRLDNELRLSLQVAPDEAAVDAWRRGELAAGTVVVAVVDQDELPITAWEECCRMGRAGAIACPAITVGPQHRMPSPTEVALATEGLQSLAALFSEAFSAETLEVRSLPSGEEIRVEVGREELTRFPRNEGGPGSHPTQVYHERVQALLAL